MNDAQSPHHTAPAPIRAGAPARRGMVATVVSLMVCVAVATLVLTSASPAAAQRGPVRLAQAEGEEALCEAFESFVLSEFDQEFVEDVFDAAVRADAVPNSVLLALRDLNETELDAVEADELLATVNDELEGRCGIEGPAGAGFNTGSPGSDSGDEADDSDDDAGDDDAGDADADADDDSDSDASDSDASDADSDGADDSDADDGDADDGDADDGDADDADNDDADDGDDDDGDDGDDEIVSTGPGSNNGTAGQQPSDAIDELPRTGGPRESVLVIGLSFAACCLVVLGSALRLIEDRA